MKTRIKLGLLSALTLLAVTPAGAAPKNETKASPPGQQNAAEKQNGNAASGTPQRSSEPPAALQRNLDRGVPGLQRAIEATEGSNSRLQDLPVSP